MNTPIYDFVKNYNSSKTARLHMPGHKGKSYLGCEPLDITEINGADVLYDADGIIAESENNASLLFGTAHSFYSTEGSTLCIKAMLALAAYDGDIRPKNGERPSILAARNVHKAFIHACALLDLDVRFIFSQNSSHLCDCDITSSKVKEALSSLKKKPCAVYVTSPDYLGNILDIKEISKVCKEYGVPLLVDNAHGAYLAFLESSLHPIALGADMCCDSAHKTLPALTGAAYLHVSVNAPVNFLKNARTRLSIFASTSPSYLTLQSLDLCNKHLSDGYRERLHDRIKELSIIKNELRSAGFELAGDEPLKLTLKLDQESGGGEKAAELLRANGIECEYCDKTRLTLMISAENSAYDIEKMKLGLLSLPENLKKSDTSYPRFEASELALSIREAILSPSETVPINEAIGRICASPTVSCPPAIPLAISGERITEQTVRLLRFYGIDTVSVVSKSSVKS